MNLSAALCVHYDHPRPLGWVVSNGIICKALCHDYQWRGQVCCVAAASQATTEIKKSNPREWRSKTRESYAWGGFYVSLLDQVLGVVPARSIGKTSNWEFWPFSLPAWLRCIFAVSNLTWHWEVILLFCLLTMAFLLRILFVWLAYHLTYHRGLCGDSWLRRSLPCIILFVRRWGCIASRRASRQSICQHYGTHIAYYILCSRWFCIDCCVCTK